MRNDREMPEGDVLDAEFTDAAPDDDAAGDLEDEMDVLIDNVLEEARLRAGHAVDEAAAAARNAVLGHTLRYVKPAADLVEALGQVLGHRILRKRSTPEDEAGGTP